MELYIPPPVQKFRVNSEIYWDYLWFSDACKIHYNQPILELKILGEEIEIL